MAKHTIGTSDSQVTVEVDPTASYAVLYLSHSGRDSKIVILPERQVELLIENLSKVRDSLAAERHRHNAEVMGAVTRRNEP